MNILLYGGSFNPVHLAHINNIKLACLEYDFDKVIIIPSKYTHFKDNSHLASQTHRLKMLDLALSLIDIDTSISYLELENATKMYTIDVVKQLKKEYKNDKLYFLIGSDQAQQLDKWHDITLLKELVQFIVIKRTEDYQSNDFLVLDNQVLSYSSTSTRNNYQSTGITSIDQYIRENGLYLDILIKNNLSLNRYKHTLNVASLAVEQAKNHNLNEKQAYVAAMLHDCTKEMKIDKQYQLIQDKSTCFELNNATSHAYAAYYYARDILKINDEQVLSAIKYHTTAYFKMTALDKLIFCADMLSKERDFTKVDELRELFDKDLNECFKQCFNETYKYLIKKQCIISSQLEELKLQIERDEV